MDEAQHGPAAKPADSNRAEPARNDRRTFWRRRPVILISTALLGVLFFFGLRYLAESFTHESTDDAFLDGPILSIAPKVAGRVQKVAVTDNQRVEAGQVLLELEPQDLQVQLDQKRAASVAAQGNVELIRASLGLFRAQIAAAEATSKQSDAEAAASEATAQRARADLKRAEDLMANHTISPQEFDSAKAAATAAEASFRAAQEKAASDHSKEGQAQAQLAAGQKGYERAEAQTRQAEWDVKAAELNLSYARVLAPEAGYVTKKTVELGDYLQIGQNLMALVPGRLWVTANFKETQLTRLRTNQPVTITIDSVAGRSFAGRVDSIQAGSGARFSLLPPENAVGNYVKVVQRVPVKIVFDGPLETGHVLGPGMSAVPSVRVKDYQISETVVALVAAVAALILGAIWWMATQRGTPGGR